MKDVSQSYIDQEEAAKKKPTELHRIWRGAGDQLNVNTWFYTIGDVAVPYNGKNYIPATLQRSLVKWDAQLEVTRCTVQAAALEVPFVKFIAINPVEILWYSIVRLHRDMEPWPDPSDVEVIFVGQIKSVSFKGVAANIELVGFEFFLSMPVPVLRYQLTCNWTLFESYTVDGTTLGCKLDKETYRVNAPDTNVDATGLILTNAIFDIYDDGYFVGGSAEFGDEKRTIISHVGSAITIAYPMGEVVGGSTITVDVYPGCDGRPETCMNKFLINNKDNALFFPLTPEDNPAIPTG